MDANIFSEKNAKMPSILAILAYKDTKDIINRRFIIPVLSTTLKNFKADLGLVIDDPRPMWHTVIIGLGERGKGCRIDNFRHAAAILPRHLEELSRKTCLNAKDIAIMIPDEDSAAVEAVIEGFFNGLYEFGKFKTKKEKTPAIEKIFIISGKPPEITSLLEPSVKAGRVIAESVHLARNLANMPSNELTPAKFLHEAKSALAENKHIYTSVHDAASLERMGLKAILAVGKGSVCGAVMMIVKYNAPGYKGRPVVLVGKGVTFDSGGISLKPSLGMEKMKYDMAGAANVLATIKAVAELKLPVSLVGVLPLVENSIGERALRPGDIIRSCSGKTIEIISTDAEGRLLLADACSFAVRSYKPLVVVTIATLTGACGIVAGNVAACLMGNDRILIDEIKNAGERVGEKVQILELFPEYEQQIKSKIADIKNTGGKGAEVVTAAMFIQKFLELSNIGAPKWAHLDIASTAYINSQKPPKSYFSYGATGWGVRLLIEFLRRNYSVLFR
jgi:leucyl aminopeptidase